MKSLFPSFIAAPEAPFAFRQRLPDPGRHLPTAHRVLLRSALYNHKACPSLMSKQPRLVEVPSIPRQLVISGIERADDHSTHPSCTKRRATRIRQASVTLARPVSIGPLSLLFALGEGVTLPRAPPPRPPRTSSTVRRPTRKRHHLTRPSHASLRSGCRGRRAMRGSLGHLRRRVGPLQGVGATLGMRNFSPSDDWPSGSQPGRLSHTRQPRAVCGSSQPTPTTRSPLFCDTKPRAKRSAPSA